MRNIFHSMYLVGKFVLLLALRFVLVFAACVLGAAVLVFLFNLVSAVVRLVG